MFNSLSDRLTATFANLKGKGRLTESDINATIRDIRMALLDADVALPVVKQFTRGVRERALGAEVSQALNPGQQVVKIVNEELVAILGGQTRSIQYAKTGPTVIMLAGLQGSGKTTFAGKLARRLRDEGHFPVLVAADLIAMAALEPLVVLGPAWLWGEAAAVAVALVPGLVLGELTARRRAIRVRSWLQTLLFTAILTWCLPTVALAFAGRSWGEALAAWSRPVLSLWIQGGLLLAIVAQRAVADA